MHVWIRRLLGVWQALHLAKTRCGCGNCRVFTSSVDISSGLTLMGFLERRPRSFNLLYFVRLFSYVLLGPLSTGQLGRPSHQPPTDRWENVKHQRGLQSIMQGLPCLSETLLGTVSFRPPTRNLNWPEQPASQLKLVAIISSLAGWELGASNKPSCKTVYHQTAGDYVYILNGWCTVPTVELHYKDLWVRS